MNTTRTVQDIAAQLETISTKANAIIKNLNNYTLSENIDEKDRGFEDYTTSSFDKSYGPSKHRNSRNRIDTDEFNAFEKTFGNVVVT